MRQLRVGVIGVGEMGQRHCRVYSNLRKTELVGVCDLAVEQGQKVADQYEVAYYQNIDDLLSQVDAVSLVTPTPLHFRLAKHCIERGVHVLIEKPITETPDQARELTEIAESGQVVVQVGHIERFNPGYNELKNVLKGLSIAALNFRRLSSYQSSNTDVDVVLDLMIHDIDLVLDLIGDIPTQVAGYGLTAYGRGIDHAVAQLGFENGPIVTLTASRITEHQIRSLDVTALEAYLEADLLNKSILVHRRTMGEYLNFNHRGVKYRQESIVERIHVPIFEPLFLELQQFTNCVLEDQQPAVSARDGLNALELASRIRQTIHQGIVRIEAV
jgi:predicted dehydrogenase